MRLESGVALKLGAQEGSDSTLSEVNICISVGHLRLDGSYIFVTSPEKLLGGVEGHRRNRRRQRMGSRRRKWNASDLSETVSKLIFLKI
jgi:hypothetical protein